MEREKYVERDKETNIKRLIYKDADLERKGKYIQRDKY